MFSHHLSRIGVAAWALCLIFAATTLAQPTGYEGYQVVRITVAVTNEGQTRAMEVFVQLYVDDVPTGQAQYISSIEPGSSENFTMLWRTNSSGLHRLRVVADFQDDISETNEDNNEAESLIKVRSLKVKSSPGPTIALALFAFIAATGTVRHLRRRRRTRGGRQRSRSGR